uniref:tRNA pseudouridine synthase B n=1 Tax=Candidatus Actinomarina minuta TaxID=1389454 RepID=S5DQJ6_9ACTN|nr:pseudouridine synthase [Candidatus Actinomarina minuta]
MQSDHKPNFYLLDKPKTWTSQDLCTKIKKNFNFNKVGHSGTLDPNADGLMLLATDSYTKLFDYIENTDKTYKATAILGYSSPTLDVDSDLIFHENINAASLTKDIENFLGNLVGESFQTPPIYSAIKVKGKRLYKYARQNQEVDIPVRKIIVDNTELLSVESNKVTFQITVSKGTYIRSIVEELGKSLNTVAIVEKLSRTSIGNLDINHSKLNKNIETMDYKSNLQSLDWKEVINLPILEINQEVLKSVQHGQLILSSMFSNQEKYILSINNDAVAIYKPFNEKYFKPDKVLL